MPGSNLFSKLTSAVDVCLVDENGLAVLVKSTSAAALPTTPNVFQQGCLAIITATSDFLYINVGTAASPNWKDPGGGGGGPMTLTDGQIFIGNISDEAEGRAVTGDIAISDTGVTSISTGVIVDADIASGAAIATSKLQGASAGNIIVADVSNFLQPVAMSGDVTISPTGVTTVANAAVSKAKLAVSLQPSHIIVKAGNFNTVGGDATETISDAVISGSDFIVATMRTLGVSPVTILSATTTSSTATITLSADPSNDHVISYIIYRAAP